MSDPYQILGVAKSSTPEEIKSAYRKLAKKLHPDVNPGRKDIEQKFKEITAAYDLLSDKDKRARYDRGEIDSQGQDRGFGGGNPFGGGRGGGGGRHQSYTSTGGAGGDPFSQFGMEGMEDILSEFMGGRGGKRGGRQAPPQKGADIIYSVTVPFVEAALGGKRRLNLSGGKTIDVTIPPGTSDGHKLRLRGQGETLPGGAGDAIIEIKVEAHPFFTRKENDVTLDAPISLNEALLGASIDVPTLSGQVSGEGAEERQYRHNAAPERQRHPHRQGRCRRYVRETARHAARPTE